MILADCDKVEMDATIASEIGKHRMRIVTRSGSTMSPTDLHLASLATTKAIVVLALVINPSKRAKIKLAPGDSVIVIAEN